MKIFISGKMSGEPNYNRAKFNQVAKTLTEQGHHVMNPAILPDGFEHNEYLHICKAMIDCCDAVYMLKGWELSLGANLEYIYAAHNEKKTMYE